MALLTGIELCAGVGMLGEGVRAAFRFLGHDYRTVAYVEREAYAAAQLVTLMESGCVDAAPVWSDMLTFDGGQFRGKVDCVIAGFPCQDLSIAGRRSGLDGQRSGLFFRVCDIADDCGAQFLILENVSAIASATASAVDETEGDLKERAAARVMGELADRGWDSEWITISASDVGASHRRARWFCFAWRVADTERAEWRPQRVAGDRRHQGHDRPGQTHSGAGIAEQTLGHARLQHQQLQQRTHGAEYQGAGEPVDDATGARCDGTRIGPDTHSGSGQCVSSEGCASVGNAECTRRAQAGSRSSVNTGRESEPGRGDVANTIRPRSQERTGGGSNDESFQQNQRADALSVCDALGIFAPGPDSADWPGIISRFPWLAPATQPGVCGVVDGNPLVVDKSRTHQLRALGNGVVPLQAATALVALFWRSGIRIE